MDNLELQLEQASRSRRLADILRKKAIESQYQENPGRMVSGHYVAPSWAQGLNQVVSPIMDRQAAQQAEYSADRQEAGSNALRQTALKNWQAQMPQDVPGTPEQAGPMDPSNPTELDAVAPRPVTTGQILKHTLAGGMIPGNEKMSALYNTSAMKNLEREDTQQFRREEATANRAAALQRQIDDRKAKFDEFTLRLEDRALDRTSREMIVESQGLLRAQLAADTNELRRMAIEAKRDADSTARAEKKNVAAEKAKNLSDKVRAELDSHEAAEKALTEGIAALKKAPGERMGWIPGLAQNYIPGGGSLVNLTRDGGTNAAIQIITYVTDEIRHGRFGSALTVSEKASAAQYLPSEYDTKAQTVAKAEGIQHLIQLNMRRQREREKSTPGAAQNSPTQAQVDAMPKGTKFTGSDGKEYVKD